MSERIILGGGESRTKRLSAVHRKVRRWLLLAGLLLLIFGAMNSTTRQMRVRQAHLDISRISHAARLFRADFQRCPHDIEELLTPPEGQAYLQPVLDPWGSPYRITCPAYHDENDVQVVSNGPDGEPIGRDNVSTMFFSKTP